MKNQNLFTLALLTGAFAFSLTSCEVEDQGVLTLQENVESLEIQSEDPASVFTGENDPQLTREWWKFVMDHDCNNNPLNYSNLAETEFQSGPVVFLVGSINGTASRNIVVRSDQALLVPVFNTIQFEECNRPAVKPAVDQLVEYSLTDKADEFIDLVTNLKVVLDDQAVRIRNEHRNATGVFTLTAKKDLSECLNYCITGQEQRVASDGYWITLKGLSPGLHKLHTHGEILHNGLIQDVYYNIFVQ